MILTLGGIAPKCRKGGAEEGQYSRSDKMRRKEGNYPTRLLRVTCNFKGSSGPRSGHPSTKVGYYYILSAATTLQWPHQLDTNCSRLQL